MRIEWELRNCTKNPAESLLNCLSAATLYKYFVVVEKALDLW